MGSSYRYSPEEEILIIELYTRTPNEKIGDKNPEIIELNQFFNDNGYTTTVTGIRCKMENLKSVDPEYTEGGRVGRSHMSIPFRELWLEELETGFADLDVRSEEAVKKISLGKGDKPGTPIRYARRAGQDAFRERVLTAFGGECCISGMSTPSLIQACHIKPYSTCHDEGRTDQEMDVRNGLCMNALFHRAFDAGLFTIDEDHRVLLSDRIGEYPTERNFFKPYSSARIHETGRTIIGEEYLDYHRHNIFLD